MNDSQRDNDNSSNKDKEEKQKLERLVAKNPCGKCRTANRPFCKCPPPAPPGSEGGEQEVDDMPTKEIKSKWDENNNLEDDLALEEEGVINPESNTETVEETLLEKTPSFEANERSVEEEEEEEEETSKYSSPTPFSIKPKGPW